MKAQLLVLRDSARTFTQILCDNHKTIGCKTCVEMTNKMSAALIGRHPNKGSGQYHPQVDKQVKNRKYSYFFSQKT